MIQRVLTKKILIHRSPEQEEVLLALSEKCRRIYAFALAERKEWWDRNKDLLDEHREKKITCTKQQNDLPAIKERFPEFKWMHGKVLQMALRKLDNNHASFYSLREAGYAGARLPKFNYGKKEKRELSDRVITCDCGRAIDRKKNSAVNIMLRFLSHQPHVNGEPLERQFLDG